MRIIIIIIILLTSLLYADTLTITAVDVSSMSGDIHAEIFIDGGSLNPPAYTPYIFGEQGSHPYIIGEYSVDKPGYDFELWCPSSVGITPNGYDYDIMFIGTQERPPIFKFNIIDIFRKK